MILRKRARAVRRGPSRWDGDDRFADRSLDRSGGQSGGQSRERDSPPAERQ
ncbi:hypothetical protein GCM10010502_41960 [Kitasatospora aureofaciens]|uniref:Uncharacterized protein n=1 Tax=Kitasatospora aureofaciens TaxID=1894 RepID=A0A8H9HS81_KITAU|nr:hypothetical protein GCM10010502_41960 [Kitasatospora aureofaciens]